ncbi:MULTISPECIES: exodeoxyribonuclease V subunit alpha [Idiomarina]|mgnify:FL=1|jgi:exodeoxyribonuclease V alpha subunit|uniref:exodeoxyribonuclease V subunit alpha n=1 Tax=Idiomarina TaxID=135575 RepID=UPI000C0AD9CD|nr:MULTISPECIES: exodeoxyribonuclease V subunit alpha [Idiomarina]MAC34662.1 exodeoxyribonuclease V subunit alpha [Haliea sp.]MAO67104.1 exodeoxyribonuclease V subunit alpha [Idiomarina sp.]MBF80226.1 exodeoxyribonuclease V subunit alpha [Idiomarina sp.]|tara:strand:- start:7151 stop:9073 length:1923 start_codon:yes stop_codon:yes gene_type:complete
MTEVTSNTLFGALREWRDAGWIRSIDLAFVEFLQQAGETRSEVLLAALCASHEAGRGHTSIDIKALQNEPESVLSLPPENRYSPNCDTPSELFRQFGTDVEAALTQSQCVDSDGKGNQPLVLSGGKLYLRRYWQYEAFIESDLQARMGDRPVTNDDLLKSTLAKLFAQAGNEKTDDINWQRVACANTVRNRFSVITGGPGTGKTYTVVRLLTALQHQTLFLGLPPLRVSLAAPTGKAAARLTESIESELNRLRGDAKLATLKDALDSIKPEGKTLHRLLGVKPNSRAFKHHADNPLRTDVVIVDEASMIDIEMMTALLKATPKNARLVLIGDKDQLASVEAGAVLGNLCEGADQGHYRTETGQWLQQVADTPAFPSDLIDESGEQRLQHVVKFRKSYRFTGPIADLANAINRQDNAATKQELEKAKNADGDYPVSLYEVSSLDAPAFEALIRGSLTLHVRGNTETTTDANNISDIAQEALQNLGNFQILTALREGPWGVKAVNQKVGDILGVNANTWYEGRPVMVTKNDYGLKLNNGDIGLTFKDPEHGHLRVAFPDQTNPSENNGVRWVLPSRLTHIETVYAMTVHKSQGSEFKHTVMVLPDHDSPVLSKELLYTGITRAKEKLSLVGKKLLSLGDKNV